MVGLFDSLYRSFQNSKFKPVRPTLAVDAWAAVPGVRFGLPWPWSQCSEFEAPRDTEPIIGVEVPRTDYVVQFVMWRTLDTVLFDQVVASAGAQLAQLHRGRTSRVEKVLLDRSRGVLVAIDEPGGTRTWRLLAEWGGRLLHGQLSVPLVAAAGYESHIDTMLGSWEWAG